MRYVVSPYESDAQRAFLISKGFADFAMLHFSYENIYIEGIKIF